MSFTKNGSFKINPRVIGFVRKYREGTTVSGSPMVTLSIPVDSVNGEKEYTNWYNLTAFGAVAENLKKLNNRPANEGGGLIGRYMMIEYEDRPTSSEDEGKRTYSTSRVIAQFGFLAQPRKVEATGTTTEEAPAEQALQEVAA